MEKTRQKYFWMFFTVLFQTSSSLICRSIDARNNVTALEQLRGCTVVEGYVNIVLMEKSFEEEDFEPYTFLELREITQYLVFYRVRGLRSLGRLFPNLEKIRGDGLFQDFALVIYEMFNLQEIGLINLKEISRGSVNIVKNPSLCFANTVNWGKITQWDAVRNYESHNGDDTSCPGCPDHCKDAVCWNSTYCQFIPDGASTEGCDPLCVGHCFEPGPKGCYSCRGFFDLEGNCVRTCPPNTYQYLNRRCVERKDCFDVIYENQCLEICPSGYEPTTRNRGAECVPCKEGRCKKLCNPAEINSIADAERFRGCTHINGSIEITIRSETSRTVHSILEETLGSIEEIKGYLQVTRSSVTDLNFLKNLSVIRGNETNKDKKKNFALVIFSNENLQELWDLDTKRFSSVNGRLYFHHNPKLCLQHIYKLMDVIGYDKNVSNFEISKESNGDKFPCNGIEINITVTYKGTDRLEVHVPYKEMNNTQSVLRHVVYYTKDPFKNITIFDDFDQCSDYGWKTKDIPVVDEGKDGGFRVNLTELEPDTNYVIYVTSYTIYSVSARSGMHRESTLPTAPSELTKLRAYSNSSSEIVLEWEHPKPGEFSKYVVSWYILKEDRAFIDQRNYCDHPLMRDIEADKPVSIPPKLKVDNKVCCSTLKYLPKEGFEMLCNNFVTVQFPIGFTDKAKYPTCESYFYSYIYNSPFQPSKQHDSLPLHIVTDENNRTISMKLGKNKDVSASQNQIPNTKIKPKHRIIKEVKHFPKYSKEGVLMNLTHFQNYVIHVKACRVENSTETNTSESNRCSKSEIVTVRTKGNKESDVIPPQSVSSETKKESLKVSWEPPEKPNGLVVAFEVEYRHRDIENPKHMKECLTYVQYKNNKNQFFIDGLPPGKYEFRIQAITLFGKGPFTQFTAFDIDDKITISILEIISIVLAGFVVLILVLASTYFSKPSKYNIVIADVNPNYHYVPDHYEIDRDDVEFGRELGIGSFGKVYEGRLKSQDLRCAIKTVNGDATEDNENEFLIEASVMKSMTNAYFVVKLLGVVSKGRPPLVLMELMDHGDLKSYLRLMRELNPITNAVMIKMAMEIADGMAYMEAHKFVHRDLAARNCMVSSQLIIKVGDFGMARDIYETDYYRKKNKGFLPIRWMAPESLRDGEFTSQSDIWSYGVVLWEIVTMAEQPYQGFSNDQVLRDVIAGRRLEFPTTSPLPLKSLMTICWRTKPANRTSFMNIVGTLKYYHDEEYKMVAYYYSEEAETIRKGMWEYVEMKPVIDKGSMGQVLGMNELATDVLPTSSYSLATVGQQIN